MTVSSTSSSVTYSGNGVTTVFPYAFPIPTEDGVVVTITNSSGAQTVIVPPTYSITGIGSESGGNVTYTGGGTPLPIGSFITIERDLPLVQLTDIGNQSGYYPEVIEQALDYLTMLIQQVNSIFGRAIVAPITDSPSINLTLPPAAARANKSLLFGTDGGVLAGSVTGAVVSAAMIPVVAAASIAIAQGLLGISVPPIGIRERLTASRDYFVNVSTGNDANSGLSALVPFKTIQKASDTIQDTLDCNGQIVRVFCAEGVGVYAGFIVKGPYLGARPDQVTFYGSTDRTITNATNATPVVITTSANHGFVNNQHVVIGGVVGNTVANGAYKITVLSGTTFSLQRIFDSGNVVGNGAYVSGGICASPENCPILGVTNAVRADYGATFQLSGFSITSGAGQGIIATWSAVVKTVGAMDLGLCGADQLFGSRRGYVEIGFNFSVSGGSTTGGWAGASHGGEVRKVAEGFFVASVTYGGTYFAFTDFGDVVDTTISAVPISITAATNATPIVVTTAVDHKITTGEVVQVENCTGNTAANGSWMAVVLTATTFQLINFNTGANSVGNGAYGGGGVTVGMGFTWNKQGFTVPSSGTVVTYLQTQLGDIQTIGVNPPFQDYYPGNSPGVTRMGNVAAKNSYYTSIVDNLFQVTSGPINGFLVTDPSNTVSFFQVGWNPGATAATFTSNCKVFGTLGVNADPVNSSALMLPGGTTARSSLRLGGGVAPTAPQDGDIWFTNAVNGLFIRVNGVTRFITTT